MGEGSLTQEDIEEILGTNKKVDPLPSTYTYLWLKDGKLYSHPLTLPQFVLGKTLHKNAIRKNKPDSIDVQRGRKEGMIPVKVKIEITDIQELPELMI